MANEYQVHGANVQVLRTPEVTYAQVHGANVQVLRTVSTASATARRRQIISTF